MSDRAKLMNILKENGYSTETNEGVLMVVLPREQYVDKSIVSNVSKIIKTAKYDRSWGIKIGNKAVE